MGLSMNIMKKYTLALACASTLGMVMSAGHAQAATPANTLVIAMAIDDVISLDPAESFEISSGEILNNTYQRLIATDPTDPTKLIPQVAESWTISEDGKTLTFKVKQGLKFASGNPLTAHDAAYSLQRAIKIDQGPAFILSQFGLNKDNVDKLVYAPDDNTVVFTTTETFSPSFVLNCLTSTVASIVDSKLVEEHAVKVEKSEANPFETDFGYDWLKRNYAGSGAYSLRDWRPNEVIMLDRNENYSGSKPGVEHALYRHVKESVSQRLLLQAGDVDVARNLEPGDIAGFATNSDFNILSAPKGNIYFLAMNQNNADLAKPEVRQALKYLVDYDAIQNTLINGIGRIHQSFLPVGMFGAVDDKPFKLDIEKAKQLLADAGLKDGFSITLDVRNTQPVVGIAESIQQTFAKAGIKVELLQGEGKLTLTKVRARKHQLALGLWGPDYWDPHTNASTFAYNPNNGDNVEMKTTAWRSAWDIPEMTKETRAAVKEIDVAKREQMYHKIQKDFQDTSPFVMLYQQIETAVAAKNVHNFNMVADANYIGNVTKD